MDARSLEYEEITKKIDALDAEIAVFEKAKKTQKHSLPNSPEHKQATEKLKEVQEPIRKARERLEKILEIEKAKQVLKKAEKARSELAVGSAEYEEATKKIDTLDTAIAVFEKAKEAQQATKPDSPAYKQATEELEKAREALKKARLAIEDPSVTETNQSKESSQNFGQISAILENTEPNIKNQSEVAGPPKVDLKGNLEQKGDQLKEAVEQLQNKVEAESELKKQLVITVTELQLQQSALIDRFEVVLDELKGKGGDSKAYQKYIQAVSGVEIDLQDTEGLGLRLVSWVKSEEGGLHLVSTLGILLGTTIGFLLLGLIVDRIYMIIQNRVLTRLLEEQVLPILQTVSKLTIWMVIIVVGLNTAGLEVTTILTGLGIGGFAIALAAQDTLSNILGGFTLLIQKKVGLGQRLEISGIKAKVQEIGLRTTTLVELDYDYQVVVPNRKFLQEMVAYIDSRPHYAVYEILHLHHTSSSEQIELAMDLIKQIAAENDRVKGARPSFVDFNDYGFDIKFVFWIKKWEPSEKDIFPNDLWKIYTVRSQMNLAVLQQFEAHNLKLALPIQLQELPKAGRSSLFNPDSNETLTKTTISEHFSDLKDQRVDRTKLGSQ